MLLSIEVDQHYLSWDAIRERTLAAEEYGFDGVWVFDHFRPIGGDPNGPCLEGWTLLAALAAVTRRVRLGTLVTGITYRHPSLLAAETVTVDHVSGGRVELAVGAAWFEGEHRQLGFPFPSTRERTERLEESIELIRLLMTQNDVSYAGRHYRLDHATYEPRPVQRPHPPIWIGASGERLMLPIVARRADVWHHSGPLEEMIRKSRLIDEYARQFGRDPRAIARAGSIRLDDDLETIRRTAHGFRDAGFSRLVCVWPTAGLPQVERFARDLLSELQAL